MAKNNQQSNPEGNLEGVKGSVDSNESVEAVANEKATKQGKSAKVKGSVDSNYELEAKDSSHYHVRHARWEKLPSGASVEDPGSVRIQMYDRHVFEDQILNQEKGLPSIWDMGESLTVLHDPTK